MLGFFFHVERGAPPYANQRFKNSKKETEEPNETRQTDSLCWALCIMQRTGNHTGRSGRIFIFAKRTQIFRRTDDLYGCRPIFQNYGCQFSIFQSDQKNERESERNSRILAELTPRAW